MGSHPPTWQLPASARPTCHTLSVHLARSTLVATTALRKRYSLVAHQAIRIYVWLCYIETMKYGSLQCDLEIKITSQISKLGENLGQLPRTPRLILRKHTQSQRYRHHLKELGNRLLFRITAFTNESIKPKAGQKPRQIRARKRLPAYRYCMYAHFPSLSASKQLPTVLPSTRSVATYIASKPLSTEYFEAR
jgi:hypothetical protein